jgi:transposase
VSYPGSGKPWTKQHVAWLASLELAEPSHRIVLEDSLRELRHHGERNERMTRHVEELAATPAFAPKVGPLRCLRGIDTYSAMVVATEIISPERFARAPKLMAYLGLAVAEASSGQTQRRLGLTKTGNVRARRILVEAAHHARHSVSHRSKGLKQRRTGQPEWAIEIAERAERRLHDRYWALLGGGKQPCKVSAAVARELAGFVWAILIEASRRSAAPRIDADGVVQN